ncbi:metal ABC transporter ATP-binding protein [Reyranella sp.]|uniref:metal ABC transporter ATP-binding protein n=1 Tax=Reyranella sp. TaxID=1929291 RepID=UPI003BAB219A
MSAIRFRTVTLGHGRRHTLEKASFDIATGSFIGLLGANGAGKTTLLRALLGLLPPLDGSIEVLGSRPARGDRRIGYVPQMHRTFSEIHLAGRDLLIGSVAGLRLGWPFSTAEDEREVARVLDLVDGRDLADRPISSLSGGERQRLLMAQALLGRPSMLLLDEPLVSLDPNHHMGVVELVSRVREELGMTVLFSSHELTPLLGSIDGVLYLGRRSVALGTVDDVITPECLSRLYDAPIDVVRAGGRIFVVAAGEVGRTGRAHAAV